MTGKDIEKELLALGLAQGDTVLLHSSLASIGRVNGGAETVVKAFLKVLGKKGTLAVPVFGNLGIITTTVKNLPGAVISPCPKGTIAAVGAYAEELCKDHWRAESAHGEDTPYTRIAARGGYICLLGVDQDRNTTLHTVEALLKLPYLATTPETVFETPEGQVSKAWKYYPGPHRDFIGLDRCFRESGAMKTGKIGCAVTRLIKAADLLKIGMELGRRDPAFCLCANPNCEDCVTQRAAIFRNRISGEDFMLAASSALAGRYIPEMIENLKRAGIDYIELDIIQGKPLNMHNPDFLKAAVAELRANNIKVSGLRYPGTPDDLEKVFNVSEACGVNRILLPLGHNAKDISNQAVKHGLETVFFNAAHTGAAAAALVRELPAKGFAFSPAGFAAAGEMPFLRTFQSNKFRNHISQLYIEDGLWDGTAVPLANGNAEIKELMSILRCAGFSGYMVLRNKAADFAAAVSGFTAALDAI